jgi:hypothetical protein
MNQNLKISNEKDAKRAKTITPVKRAMKAIARFSFNILTATFKFIGKQLVLIFKIGKALTDAITLNVELKIAKQNPTKIRKMLARCVTLSAVIGIIAGISVNNNFFIKSAASDNKEEIVSETSGYNGEYANQSVKISVNDNDYLVGMISSKYEIGTTDMSHILDNQYGQFSLNKEREDYVLNFFVYMVENYQEIFNKYFSQKGEPGSASFNEAWKLASQEEGVFFNQMQQKFKWDNLVTPVADKIKKETKVDLNKSLLLQELVYSTVSQYESETAYEIFINANINKKMSELEIMNAVQDEKINSLGVYTYTEKDSNYHEIIKTRINNERNDLTTLAGKDAADI